MTNGILERTDTRARVSETPENEQAVDFEVADTVDFAETAHKPKARNRAGARRNVSAKAHSKTEAYSAEAHCRLDRSATGGSLSAESETFMFNICVPPETVLDMISAATQPQRTEPACPNWRNLSNRCNTLVVGNKFQISPKSKVNQFARRLHGAVYPTPRGSRVEYTLAASPKVRTIFALCFAFANVLLLAGLTTVITSGARARFELIAVPLLLMIIGMSIATLGLWLSRKGEAEIERLLRNIETTAQPDSES